VFTSNTGDLRHPNSVFSFLWIIGVAGFLCSV
jgi:hypothetical protein